MGSFGLAAADFKESDGNIQRTLSFAKARTGAFCFFDTLCQHLDAALSAQRVIDRRLPLPAGLGDSEWEGWAGTDSYFDVIPLFVLAMRLLSLQWFGHRLARNLLRSDPTRETPTR